jgi:hypothetical protein
MLAQRQGAGQLQLGLALEAIFTKGPRFLPAAMCLNGGCRAMKARNLPPTCCWRHAGQRCTRASFCRSQPGAGP